MSGRDFGGTGLTGWDALPRLTAGDAEGNLAPSLTRRDAIRKLAALVAGLGTPASLLGCGDEGGGGAEPGAEISIVGPTDEPEDESRLHAWVETLRSEGLADAGTPFGSAAIRVGELAIGTPYEGFTLEGYIRAGGSPVRSEPLTLSLTEFDCVSLVEACLAIARVARGAAAPSWETFAREMERMRYRGGNRLGYASRLHYFSDWLHDSERRGLLRMMSGELGGVPDERPLRFMSANPDAYPAMAYPEVRAEIAAMERTLDGSPRLVIGTERIPEITDRLQSGDILAFATSIRGLDVTHSAFVYRDPEGIVRVLHAPLSGGVVEVTPTTLEQYVAAIRQSTGILVARPLQGS